MNLPRLILLIGILGLFGSAMANEVYYTTHCTRGKYTRAISVVKLRSLVYPYGYEIKISEPEWVAINQTSRCPANSFTLGCSLSPEQASLLPQSAAADRADSCQNGFCVYDIGGWEKTPQAVKTKTLPKVVETLKNSGWSCE